MGVANELRDFEEIPGDPWMVRRAADSLRQAAGHLPIPTEAAGRLQDVASGVSWQGDAADAYRATLDTLPMPANLRNAVNVMHAAAGHLDGYADRLRADQEAIDACRQRWLALGIPDGGDVPDDLASLVQQIDDEAWAIKQGHRAHLDQLAEAFADLTGRTVFAKPPPGIMDRAMGAIAQVQEWNLNFAYGIVEGCWEMVKGLATLSFYLNPLVLPYTATKLWESRDDIVALAQYAWENPGDFTLALGKALIDWDTLTENPARWLGKLVPDLILTVLTAGQAKLATSAARTAAGLPTLTRAARMIEKGEDVGRGLSRTQRVLERGRRLIDRVPRHAEEALGGDRHGVTKLLFEWEKQTYSGRILEWRIPYVQSSAAGLARDWITLGWTSRLKLIDGWLNGVPTMTPPDAARFWGINGLNAGAFESRVEGAMSDLDDAMNGKDEPVERFEVEAGRDGLDIDAPWSR